MSLLSALPVIGGIIESVLGVIDKSVTDKDEANRLKAQVQTQLMQMDFTREIEELRERAGVIRAEAQGESWLQRNWRPILMLTIVAVVANNYLIYPYLSMFTDCAVVLALPEELYALMKIGVGGYIVGRSAEKVVGRWTGNSTGSAAGPWINPDTGQAYRQGK